MRMFAPALSPSRLEQLLSLHAESVRKSQGADIEGGEAEGQASGRRADGVLTFAAQGEPDAER